MRQNHTHLRNMSDELCLQQRTLKKVRAGTIIDNLAVCGQFLGLLKMNSNQSEQAEIYCEILESNLKRLEGK